MRGKFWNLVKIENADIFNKLDSQINSIYRSYSNAI